MTSTPFKRIVIVNPETRSYNESGWISRGRFNWYQNFHGIQVNVGLINFGIDGTTSFMPLELPTAEDRSTILPTKYLYNEKVRN